MTMSLALNARKWWKCSGDEPWTMNLRRPNFVAKDDECYRHGGNQALPLALVSTQIGLNTFDTLFL